MSFLCPSCCLNLLGFSNSRKNIKNESEQLEHGQLMDDQENMISNLKKQTKHLPNQYFQQTKQSETQGNNPAGQSLIDMNVDLGLGKTDDIDDKKSQGSNKNNQSDQQQQQDDQILDTPTQEELKPNYNKFSINLDPYNKYYQHLHDKTQNLEQYFNIDNAKIIELGALNTKCNLKMWKFQNFSNKFIARLELPCSYSYYASLMKDSNINPQKKFMTYFERSQIIEAIKPNFTKNLIRLKRFNLLEPREFLYLKYSNGSFKQNWQICMSEGGQSQDLLGIPQAAQTDHKRCELFAISNLKQIHDNLYIRSYLQIDLKASNMNNNIWNKIISEVKEYYEKLYEYIDKNYQKQLV